MPAKPGEIVRAAVERVRGLRYVVEDVGYALASILRSSRQRLSDIWHRVSIEAQRRVVAAIGLAVAVGIVVFALIPNLPCSAPGGDECAPADNAIALVGADAGVYVHANIDPATEQGRRARELISTLPLLARQGVGQLLPLLVGAAGAPSDFARDIEPWFGGEVAVAVTVAGEHTEQVQLLEAADADGALAYAERIAAGTPTAADHEGVEVATDERGLATTLVDGFLVLGSNAGVRATIDVAKGIDGAESLTTDAVADDALGALPSHRAAEAFLAADAIAAYVQDPQGPLATLDPLIESGASKGAAFSLTAEVDGVSLASRSVLDAKRSKGEPGFFSAFDSYQPKLPDIMSPETLAYLGFGHADRAIGALLDQASVGAPGIAAGATELFRGLRDAAGLNLQEDLVGALAGEAAAAVVARPVPDGPASAAGPDSPETVTPASIRTPYLEFLANDVDGDTALEALARLQGPIAASVQSGFGVPTFERERIGDLDAEVLRVSPGSAFAYAVNDSRLLVANDIAGVERLGGLGSGDSLAEASSYEQAIAGLPDDAGLFAYMNLAGLLEFAERTTLAQNPSYGEFADDLARLQTFAIAISGDSEGLAADARVRIE